MSDKPTASNTLGLIGVELYRLHVGTASVVNLVFAAVQTDWKWIGWYSFFDESTMTSEFQTAWGAEGTTRAADILGRGFGRTNHEFRRVFLHLTKPKRVDALVDDDKDNAPAVMFIRNSLHKGNVLVDIDVNRPDGFLQLRRLHMAGHIPKELDTKSIRGTLYRWTRAQIFRQQDLADPPNGSEVQMAG
jgi:hypothetical protein